MSENTRVAVIGAGPAGMMAAGTLGLMGFDVTMFDKNQKVGRKLAITGKGRCNVTNNCDIQNLMANVAVNSKFLYSAFYGFTPADTMEFFESHGCPLKTERGNRVFPLSDKAYDIVDTLFGYCKKAGVTFKTEEITGISKNADSLFCIKSKSLTQIFDYVILSTGGKSYPVTGSDGKGYTFAQSFGHTITEIKPSLVPLTSHDKECTELMGLSLKNISIKVKNNQNGKIEYNDFGEMLFTHFGLSGPVILSASSHIRDIKDGQYSVIIDLKPALSGEQLDKRLLRDFSENQNRNFSNALGELLPSKMIPVIVRRSGISPDTKVNSVTREQRKNLVELIKGLEIEISGFRPIEEAIITSGGVDVSEINPKTMESKLIKGLYFAGEIIDVDAHTGGYNLQIAFSTGYAAAQGIIKNHYEN